MNMSTANVGTSAGSRFRPGKRRVLVIALGLIGLVGLVFYLYLSTPRLTAELRGYALAEELGCHGCHGPRGTGGTSNPRSEEAEVPSWDGGNLMMWAENDAEIREWILDGVTRRHLEEERTRAHRSAGANAHTHAAEGPDTAAHPHVHPSGAEDSTVHTDMPAPETADSSAPAHEHGTGRDPHVLPLQMPAFRDVVDGGELDALVAYVKAVALTGTMPEAARRGRQAAAERGCFGCHGPGGMLGVSNPKSFKGYIPPWRGKDFAEMVRNEEELRAWIQDGIIPRFESNQLASFFSKRQIIQMPAYRDVLTDVELDDIVTYIEWLSEEQK